MGTETTLEEARLDYEKVRSGYRPGYMVINGKGLNALSGTQDYIPGHVYRVTSEGIEDITDGVDSLD